MMYFITTLKHSLLAIFLCLTGLSCSYGQAFITRWKTDNPGNTSSSQILIPGIGTYDVQWVEVGNASNNGTASGHGTTTLTFPSIGVYEVSITGDLKAIDFSGIDDREKIISVEQWGSIEWLTMKGAFSGCTNLVIPATDAPDLSQVTNMTDMFYGTHSFNQNINHWDVSHVTNMEGLFSDAPLFNQSIGSWDVSHVTNMYAMFAGATAFNQDIAAWDVSQVTDMGSMFAHTRAFDQSIGNWDVTNVTNMAFMFNDARVFNQNLNNWDVSHVTDMQWMFGSAQLFNGNIGAWDVSNVELMLGMFSQAYSFNQDIGNWDVSNVVVMALMFDTAIAFNQNIGNWNIGKAQHMWSMLDNSGLSVENYDALLNGWSSQIVYNEVILGALNLEYCQATAARDFLVNNYDWVIEGDALNCTVLANETTSTSNAHVICYPNPWNRSTAEDLSILGMSDDETEIVISDVTGKMIYTETLMPSSGTVNISSHDLTDQLVAGTYVVKISSGQKITTRMLLVH